MLFLEIARPVYRVCRPVPVLWVGAGGQRSVNASVFVNLSAHQKQNLNRYVSAPVALLHLFCLNLFGIISLLPFCWKGKPVGVGRCAGWLFIWLYLSLLPLFQQKGIIARSGAGAQLDLKRLSEMFPLTILQHDLATNTVASRAFNGVYVCNE